ncbi:hypothetical protein ACHAXR_006748 [Thalassiosira sp. AJA248-18]
MMMLCTSVDANSTETETCNKSPSSLTVAVAVPLALGAFTISLKLLLWRARVVARWLEEDASRVWRDGSMMLDSSNEELQQSIIQNAIVRGAAALVTSSESSSEHVSAPKYYQSHSSSSTGESSEDMTATSNENENNRYCTQKMPRRMTKQVGGIASHKRPVLAFDQFILKPLRLLSRSQANYFKYSSEKTAAAGKGDKTKVYRGVREVAFYEALEFASRLPSDLSSYSEMSRKVHRVSDKGCGIDDTEHRKVVVYFLSLYKHASTAHASNAIQSFIQSFRHPCIGYHNCGQTNKLESTSTPSLKPRQIQHSPNPLKDNSLLSNLGYFNAMAFLTHHAGDPVVVSSVQSYANAWCALIKEVEALKRLSTFTSPYFGLIDLDMLEQDRAIPPAPMLQQSLQNPHLLLQNLTAPFRHPNIIDIKMGTHTFEPTAPLSKQVREAAKYPQQSEIGFRIVGMRVHDPTAAADGEYRCWDKSFGVNLKTREDVAQALLTFFQCNNNEAGMGTPYILHVISCVIKQLTQIKIWFEENATLAFYASSILIVYDGGEPGVMTSHPYQEPVLKMIDFAHVCRQTGGDTGYLRGVKSLSRIIEEILQNQIVHDCKF